ncbi:MAG: type IV pili methyl-accepting chemotaxis transducer N-terminal domain-containing protein [Planctomycetes bacterium]|nr:type IV pili methyl-accepting chemotaxis transducer N-terminal domain-containing protein [Planctomycetota bacterium]
MAELDSSAAGEFTRRYTLALGLVALLTIAAQVLVQMALHRARADAEVVNLAGRQRMLSQRLTLSALAWRDTSGANADAHLQQMRTVLAEWIVAHRRLSAGDDLPNAGQANSPQVARAFADLHAPFSAMADAAQALPGDLAAVERLLQAQDSFLVGMERIVTAYSEEAALRVQRLVALELGLCALLLVVLALEALLVFRPAVARLRQAIADRERLREQEMRNRELEVAADTARGIGQDLHDGLGQTLTALSFQAKTMERASAGTPGAETATALSAGMAEAIAQCRAQARRLAPVAIQAAGLEAALRELADATAIAAGVDCRLEWTAPGPPAAAGTDVFRICQEAVTNALRHGKARCIVIRCGPRTLAVVDDGRGGGTGTEGVGTRSMRTRAARLGAQLESSPQPEGGWAVRVVLP